MAWQGRRTHAFRHLPIKSREIKESTMAENSLLLGAVAYQPKVVTIWEGIRDFFLSQAVPLDFVLFSNYERQVDSLLKGHIDLAWNTPLAHVRVRHQTGGRSLSLGMRDTDRDFRSCLLVRKDRGINAPAALVGKTLAVGSRDSTQARILPLYFLRQAGVDLGKVQLLAFDSDVGKHGDTGTSELEVLQALREGRADAGAIGEPLWISGRETGLVPTDVIDSIWTTPPFDHCMFDARPDLDPALARNFQQALFAMSWDNPDHRRLLELEGLKQWMPPREQGYESLQAAIREQGISL
jgi:phosphonate transport system substrate-binding protein